MVQSLSGGGRNPDLDVIVIGAAGVDTNIYLAGADVDFSVESNFSQNLDNVGGAGGYSSRGFARLGKRTGFLGCIGDDHNGRFIADELSRDGIETFFLLDPVGTRRSVNIMYRDGRRKNFYDGKGSMNMQPDLELCRAAIGRARIAHMTIENWTRRLLPLAKELGVLVSCDLQDVISPDDEYRRDYIEQADILFFSAVNFPDPTPLINRFLEMKPGRMTVTGMGSRGCALGTSDGIRMFDPVTLDEPVIDTTGAGDSLAAGFLSSYFLDDYTLEDSILRGQIAARYACTQKANSSLLITREQLDAYFRRIKGV